MYVFCSKVISWFYIAFSCYLFSILQSVTICFLWPWHFWWVMIWSSVECPFVFTWCFPVLDWSYWVWAEYHKCDISFSLNHIRGLWYQHAWLIVGDVNRDDLLKVVSASFLHSTILIFHYLYLETGCQAQLTLSGRGFSSTFWREEYHVICSHTWKPAWCLANLGGSILRRCRYSISL